MKKILFIGLLLTATIRGYGQDDSPVHWQFSSKRISALVYELHIKAMIDPPYHIYSQKSETDVGLPTRITFTSNALVEMQGGIAEKGELQNHKDATSGNMLSYYSDEVDFVKIVKLKHKGRVKIKGHVSYMACTNDHCLPEAKQLFTINIGQ